MRIVLVAALACLLLVSSGNAASVTVPDDFATIQAAIDSGADSVFVRPGVYHERPEVPREVALLQGLAENGVRPRIDGLHVYEPCYIQNLMVAGCSFTGGVLVDDGCGLATVEFESCDLDSGLTNEISDTADFATIAIRRSRIAGPVVLRGHYSACESDTFVSAGVRFREEASSLVRDCVFQGPGNTAIEHFAYANGSAAGNTITGYQVGVAFENSDAEYVVERNRFVDCEFGASLNVDRRVRVVQNEFLDCGVGVDASAWGGWLDVMDNVVLGSNEAGLRLIYSGVGTIARNVVGRSGTHGIVLHCNDASDRVIVERNTSFRNAGAGFSMSSVGGRPEFQIDLQRNIGYENGTYGVDVLSTAVTDGCNDWFGNVAGAKNGLPASPTDLAIDPQFCDVDADRVTLFASSPLVNAPGCGLVGARGVGCDAASTPMPASSSRLALAPVFPNPAAGAVRIRWSSPRAEWVDVTVHDLAGRTIATVARGVHAAGVNDAVWEGGMIPSGVYFVRLRSAGATVTRSFLVRR